MLAYYTTLSSATYPSITSPFYYHHMGNVYEVLGFTLGFTYSFPGEHGITIELDKET